MPHARERIVAELRAQLGQQADGKARKAAFLPFGITDIDERLPGGGLAFGALHEVAGGGAGTIDGAAAALFVAGIAARTKGKILWCLSRPDLFAPAVSQAGLHPDRVIYAEADKEDDVLAAFEEGLAYGGLGAVVGEIVRLPMVTSRRLHLAAEKSGTMALALRRWRRPIEANDYGQPTASTTRWRISALPSEALPVAGVGRARWLAELMRVKAGEAAEFCVGACDAKGRLDLSPEVADRQDQKDGRRWRASG
jgi:protein ImuA